MGMLQSLLGALTGWWRPRQSVGSHRKYQAFGRRWSKHRPRRIERYRRSRPRRSRR